VLTPRGAVFHQADQTCLAVTRACLAAPAVSIAQVIFSHQLREVHVIVQHLYLLLAFPKPAVLISHLMLAE
jgi:hypothetical protein